jgi:hypothetical protein
MSAIRDVGFRATEPLARAGNSSFTPGTSVRPVSAASKAKATRKSDPCSSMLSAEMEAPCGECGKANRLLQDMLTLARADTARGWLSNRWTSSRCSARSVRRVRS